MGRLFTRVEICDLIGMLIAATCAMATYAWITSQWDLPTYLAGIFLTVAVWFGRFGRE